MAVNEAGPGEPSESSGNIAAKPEKGNITRVEKNVFDILLCQTFS